MTKIAKLLGAISLHKWIKNKALKKAREDAVEKTSLDNHFYISIPQERDWIDLQENINNQTFMVTIMKIKSYIENFGGEDVKIIDSNVDTKIYFKMPRTSVEPMFQDLKKHFYKISLGEVKLRKY